ncbi:hypothetical protein TNCV_1470821 [Trichonephila clavipes]|nr:hypothetical protein TNCV_1470821 [Trichonephila clavipes]
MRSGLHLMPSGETVVLDQESFGLTWHCKRKRRTTAQQVANQFLAASGKHISRKTIARRLRGGGLYPRRPVECVPLTRQHRTANLQSVQRTDINMLYHGVSQHHDQWPHAPTCGCE